MSMVIMSQERTPGWSAAADTDATPRPLQYVPFVKNHALRTAIGVVLLVLSAVLTAPDYSFPGSTRSIVLLVVAWLPAVLLTDKYTHKYPQRYFAYLAASHGKAALIMAFLLGCLAYLFPPETGMWTAFALFLLTDAMVSALRRSVAVPAQVQIPALTRSRGDDLDPVAAASTAPIDGAAIARQLSAALEPQVLTWLEQTLPQDPGGNATVLTAPEAGKAAGLLSCSERFNDARRINRLFLSLAEGIAPGGYLLGHYTPHEQVTARLHGLAYALHFLWYRILPKIPRLNAVYFWLTKGKNRLFSRVEIWGRLSYCGMKVVGELPCGDRVYVLAKRIASPSANRRPSYYPVVSLEKVGLNGELFRIHKVRTMFPFSEFLQKQVFENNGLGPTGKFKNDFRFTEYGPFLRRYWLDELPQIYDWLRGDIKLVGMRATSPQFLSLYPASFIALYIDVKPGLVPPIFDETTGGFEQIVAVELAYLESYRQRPFLTDARYFAKTFIDIVFRGIRSH